MLHAKEAFSDEVLFILLYHGCYGLPSGNSCTSTSSWEVLLTIVQNAGIDCSQR
jgi:hypothetical protein